MQLVFGLLCPLLCTGKADYHGGGFPRSRDSTMTRNWFLVVFRHKFLLLCDHSTRWGSLLFILESHPLSFDKGGLNSVERAGQSRPAQMCHIKFLFPNLFRIAPKITLGRCNCCFYSASQIAALISRAIFMRFSEMVPVKNHAR